MSYKLLEITSIYEKYIEYFYAKYPSAKDYEYDSQFNFIMEDCFAECNFLHRELAKLGVDSRLVYYNNEYLQRKWDDSLKGADLFTILLEQIKDFDPDVIFISDLGFTCEQIKIIKNTARNDCKILAWHFTTISDTVLKKFSLLDEVYTGNKYILNQIKKYYGNVRLLYHAFDESILNKIKDIQTDNSLSFLGSVMIGYHTNRLELFNALRKNKIPVSFYGDVYSTLFTKRNLLKTIIHFDLKQVELFKTEIQLKSNASPGLFGIDYYRALKRHLVALNLHTPIAGTGAGNMRMFEATGVGSCLLTDYKDENIDLFEPDKEIIVYKSFDEMCDKAKWLLNNPAKAKEIANAGQKRTLKTHSYKQKAEQINSYILNLLK